MYGGIQVEFDHYLDGCEDSDKYKKLDLYIDPRCSYESEIINNDKNNSSIQQAILEKYPSSRILNMTCKNYDNFQCFQCIRSITVSFDLHDFIKK
jgi:hypothetical protein